ncbi:MAG: NAD-dependent epimerase/dehydratase family protein [Sinobacteraceae bacterium]|nr:NAD-dependent epimerase/dehydratase family protein [Nevskiaceae bacterium]
MSDTVLILGASGLVGGAALDEFLDAGWNVIAVSRRKPDSTSGRSFRHIAVDLRDADACREAFSALTNVTHVVYAAVYEKPGLVAGWSERDQMQTNRAMLDNLLQPLAAAARNLRHVTLLQGTKAYGIHLHPMPIPARARSRRATTTRIFTGCRRICCARAPMPAALRIRFCVPSSSWAARLAW